MKHLSIPLNFLFVNTLLSLPVYPHDEENEITPGDLNYAQKNIKQFLILGGGSEGLIQNEDFLSTKIKEVQEFYGRQVTGNMDPGTMEVMKGPPCGFLEPAPYRLYPGKPRWNKSFVTYSVANYVPQLSYFETELAIWKAVNIWQEVLPLTLVRVYNIEADIMISFEPRVHGDNFPFDGRGGTLAHAFSPGRGIGGNIHFDREEHWTLRHNGVNFFHVATHEFGHALGLAHSNYRSAVMYPTYSKRHSNLFSLSIDDVRGIQHLYGTIQMLKQESALPLMPDKCDPSMSFDAVAKTDGDIFLFKNEYLWRKAQNTADAKISSIQDVWSELPSNINAACEIPGEDIIYFFKGSKLYTYTNNKLNRRSSQSIYFFGFPTYVKQIDAAVFIPQTRKIIFFVGKMYWSYNAKIKSMDYGYPKWTSSSWSGINDKIDAAYQNDGLVYFFCGTRLHEYNYWRKEIVRTLSSSQWLGCQVSE